MRLEAAELGKCVHQELLLRPDKTLPSKPQALRSLGSVVILYGVLQLEPSTQMVLELTRYAFEVSRSPNRGLAWWECALRQAVPRVRAPRRKDL